jgi:hypothetical protein
MNLSPPPTWCRKYVGLAGAFLALQGTSTLAARLLPAVDDAFPALLAQTRMVPSHSLLHIATALAAWAVWRTASQRAERGFAVGFGLGYIGLAMAGIVTGSELCLGLQPFDHPFHILLGGIGLLAAAIDSRRAAAHAATSTAPAPRGQRP